MNTQSNWPCIILIIIMLALSASGCGDGSASAAVDQTKAAPIVGVFQVQSEQMVLTTELPGRTAAYRTAEIRPQVSGIVLGRQFEEGSMVAEGQSLYTIDSAGYQAAYDKALAHLENLEKTVARQKILWDKNSLSLQDYENSLYALEVAKAEAELARLNLEYCQITVPLAGRIGRSNITEGALVSNGQGQAMAVVQQVDPIYVDLNPAVTQILKAGQEAGESGLNTPFPVDSEVILTLEDGRRYPLSGKINFTDVTVNPATGSVALRAEFPNPNGLLLPGMFVRAQVVEGVKSDGMLIPQEALVRDLKGQPQVWVLNENDEVKRRLVEVERTIGNTWLVKAGLASGERIVSEGLQLLANGVKVVPQATESLQAGFQ